jgi:hypothetical protein
VWSAFGETDYEGDGGERLTAFPDPIARSNSTRYDNPGIDSAQVERASLRCIHELRCIDAESLDEFDATRMRLRSDLNHR